LFGVKGPSGKPQGNFIDLMLKLAEKKEEIKVVNDQVMSPTNTKDLAKGLLSVVDNHITGMNNITNTGETSWYGLAEYVFKTAGLKNVKLSPITTASKNDPISRPLYSVLPVTNPLLKQRMWQFAVRDYLKEKGVINDDN
jgi:dTDP-4-dehydrorhamnose reductase